MYGLGLGVTHATAGKVGDGVGAGVGADVGRGVRLHGSESGSAQSSSTTLAFDTFRSAPQSSASKTGETQIRSPVTTRPAGQP